MADEPRFVALDIHKSYVLIAALDAQLQVVLTPRRVKMADLGSWATHWLRPTDRVVLEATINAWTIYDLLAPLVAEVQVAHPLLVKLISAARVKTDTRDTLHLARLTFRQPHSSGVGPPAGGARVVCLGGPSRAPGRATDPGDQSLAQHSAQSQPRASPPAEAGWATLPLTPLEALRVQQDRQVMSSLTTLIHSVDGELTTPSCR